MSIRIGASWVISPRGVDGYASEVRRHWFEKPEWDWRGAAKKCIDNNIYLIFNQCLGYNKTMPNPEYRPTENEWRNRIEEDVQFLRSIGGNKNNCRMTLVNEPTKYFRVENGYSGVNELISLTNLAHDQIGGRLELGSGNMEFYDSMVLGDWYRYLCRDGNFEWLDIHIQNSCSTDSKTKEYTDYAYGLADLYNKKLSCTEATHTSWDVASSNGYAKVLMQLSHAERIGCADFCVICLDLDTVAASQELTIGSVKPCFKVDGVDRSNGHYDDLMRIAGEKKPVPNIKKGIIDGMIIKTIGNNKIDTKHKSTDVSGGYSIELLHQVLINQGYLSRVDKMFTYTIDTYTAVKEFQTTLGITVDGRVGRQGWRNFINDIDDATARKKFQFDLEVVMSPYNLDGDT